MRRARCLPHQITAAHLYAHVLVVLLIYILILIYIIHIYTITYIYIHIYVYLCTTSLAPVTVTSAAKTYEVYGVRMSAEFKGPDMNYE